MGRKRDRSSEPPFAVQCKIHVNQQLLDSRDENKMKAVHAKTIDLLFKGAQSTKLHIPPEEEKDLTKLLILSGDGEIDLLYHKQPTDLSLKKKKTKCCEREAFIDVPCVNCNINLCEFCGYSCIDCGSFLCSTCIDLFGCGSIDYPKCEKCALYGQSWH